MLKKFFFRAAFLGLMLVTTSVGFAQNFRIGGWGVDYETNDFGDRTGQCQLSQTVFSEDFTVQYNIYITKFDGKIYIHINADFNDEIIDRDAYLSFKTENNKVIEADGGYYISKKEMASFLLTNEIISLFKNSLKLKMALRLQGYKPSVVEISCRDFTKSYNEMLNCK